MPASEEFTAGRAEYLLAEPPPMTATPEDFAAMDALHAYYDAHRARLRAEYQQRLADHEEQERLRKASPPPPKDRTIYFWRTEGRGPWNSR